MQPALEIRNISKAFGTLQANKNISLTVQRGSMYAILGENGAGKTTLMNILYGLYAPDDGEIFIEGKPTPIDHPKDAIDAGLGMVHQHFMLAPVLTVTENVIAGAEETRAGFVLDTRRAAAKIRAVSEQYGLEVDPEAFVKDLSVGTQQRVEIIKLLFRDARILILDEPTAVLTPQETDKLFGILKTLTEQGRTIIFITHKLKEALAFADTISVLRLGELVATIDPAETTEMELARHMVGREVVLTVEKTPAVAKAPVLEVNGLTVFDDRGLTAVDDVSLQVRAGEILGIAGVQGNGQTELVQAITGLRPIAAGTISLQGVNTTSSTPRFLREHGLGHIPEDRQLDGLLMDFPISTNMVMCSFQKAPFAKSGLLQFDTIESFTKENIAAYDIRAHGPHVPASTLSGGNQQKVIVAREFSHELTLLVASQPTRGLDIGSIEFVHRQIIRKRDEGIGVFLVSTELDEILALADRICVMFRGRIVHSAQRDAVSKEQIGLLMAGVK